MWLPVPVGGEESPQHEVLLLNTALGRKPNTDTLPVCLRYARPLLLLDQQHQQLLQPSRHHLSLGSSSCLRVWPVG